MPAYHAPTLGTEWTPAWELRAPRVATVVWSKPYYQVSRIWTGPGEQYLALGWRGDLDPRLTEKPFTREKANEVHRKATAAPRAQPATATAIVCKNAGDRTEIVNAIHHLSGPTLTRQAPVVKHPQLITEVRAKALGGGGRGGGGRGEGVDELDWDEDHLPVLCFTFAEREVKPGSYRLSFFMLTEEVLKEYSFAWRKFAIPSMAEQDAQPEDALSTNLQRTLLQQTSDDEEQGPAIGGDDTTEHMRKKRKTLVRSFPQLVKSHRARLHDHPDSPVRSRKNLGGKGTKEDENKLPELLSEIDSYPVASLSEVEFAAEEKCVLRLNFGQNVVIHFADDLGREAWREALNFTLRETNTDKTLA
eukprot:g14937.t1